VASQFAIVGGSTTAISFSDRDRILAGTENASYLVGISHYESFSTKSRKNRNPGEYAQERYEDQPFLNQLFLVSLAGTGLLSFNALTIGRNLLVKICRSTKPKDSPSDPQLSISILYETIV
ncbi:MAG TPA: hypothetical protein VGM27_14620, partial [Acidobacteriaceae bacterium]